ncbi:hypothetical protein DPSP01_014210 [Paraphaeosphaeria sporulosa]
MAGTSTAKERLNDQAVQLERSGKGSDPLKSKNSTTKPRRRRKSGSQIGDSRSSERMAKGSASNPTKPDQKQDGEIGHSESSTLKDGLNLPLKDSKENAGLKQKLRELVDDLESLAIASEFVESTLRTKIRATKVLIAALQREITESAAS